MRNKTSLCQKAAKVQTARALVIKKTYLRHLHYCLQNIEENNTKMDFTPVRRTKLRVVCLLCENSINA